MKTFTVGLLLTCVLLTLVLLQGVSGRRGGGFRGGGGYRSGGSRYRGGSSVRRSSGSSGSGGSRYRPSSPRYRPRIVPPLLLSSSRRRRSGSSSILRRQECQHCTATYIYKDSRTSKYMTGTSSSPGAQEVSICRAGTAACNYGNCSINYLWSNRTITEFPDMGCLDGGAVVGEGSGSGVRRLSGDLAAVVSVPGSSHLCYSQVESVLICGTLRHAPTLQVTTLALVMAAVMRMIGGA
uniref:Uncharacterized protein n=1 Tax=Branchiostoma floridae TaxID=7739 RepID=C3Y2S7_BRAFL|eukprot:XP_002609329.1 hypothetical protein BRAFLDRAFT_103800 [Branchiostoma floridae]